MAARRPPAVLHTRHFPFCPASSACSGRAGVGAVFLFVRGGSLAEITGRAAGADPAIGTIGERVDQLLKIVAEQEKRLAAVESRPAPQPVDLAPLAARVEGMENSLSISASSASRQRRETPPRSKR